MSLVDSITGLTDRKRKALEKSRAKPFAEKIFLTIDEDRFPVLYSSRSPDRTRLSMSSSMPLFIIKELFNLSDENVIENLMLDN